MDDRELAFGLELLACVLEGKTESIATAMLREAATRLKREAR